MFKVRGFVTTGARKCISRLPKSVLIAAETQAQMAQGKGWGAATTEQEAAATLNCLPSTMRRDPTVLDVGANIGNWTAAFISICPEANIYAFEPMSASASKVSKRFSDNTRVRVINAAVGRSSGVAELWADQSGSSLASLTRRRLEHYGTNFDFSEEVDVVTLDEWCEQERVVPVILKIDVEGHELDVLAGAVSTMSSIRVIQFEFGGCNIDTRTFFQDFFYFFQEAGFNIHRLTPAGLVGVPSYREQDESFRTTNYIAVAR